MGDVKPWDILNKNSNKASEELFSKRVSICSGCEILFKPTFQCLACGCFMKIKSKLADASCPLGKW